jgi:hypothetical protein
MVNKKTKKVEKKSNGSPTSSPGKTTAKTTSKKKSTEQKKKSPVKKVTASKVKKPVAKKDTKKPATKKPVKAKETTAKKATSTVAEKKKTGSVVSKGKADLGIKKASKSELKKVDNVIDNLSKTSKRTKSTPAQSVATKSADGQKTSFVTTVPGVFRRVPAVKKTTSSSHKATPIQGIMSYLKNIF